MVRFTLKRGHISTSARCYEAGSGGEATRRQQRPALIPARHSRYGGYSLLGFAGVVQWQNGSFPSCIRGFDSLRPLQIASSSRSLKKSRRIGEQAAPAGGFSTFRVRRNAAPAAA